jgi:leucyl aminopeptidase
MKLTVLTSDIVKAKTDLLVIATSADEIQKNSLLSLVDKKLGGELKDVLKAEDYKAKLGETKILFSGKRLGARYVAILGLGETKNFNLEAARKCGATIRAIAEQLKCKKVASVLPGEELDKPSAGELSQATAEGACLAAYQFSRYLKPKKESLTEISFYVASQHAAQCKKGITLAETLCSAVYLARDMVNTPASDMTPLALAKAAKAIKGVRVRIHNLAAIRKLKMGAFLGVAAGSTANPPYFIEMHYTPKGKAKKKIALIGKGVTFDSGGYSIKPAKSMETMKDDMAGAAAVIAYMSVIAKLAPKVAVSGYVAATENMVDGLAQRPGDIVTAMNGKTIEVLNTDAEGRLTLADAITYALKGKPDLMIDTATLTGACLVALGMNYSAIMGNDQDLIERLISAGKQTGENFWQLPLVDDYRDELKSPIADLKNIGGPYGGSINGGLFIENFVGKTKWVHADIAGPAYTEKPGLYTSRGGTGVMVRTFARLIADL